MFSNYLRIAIRKIIRNKGFAFINIFSLTIGLTGCLLIALYIKHELSYDDFQKNGNRIMRVIMEYKFAGGSQTERGDFTSVRVASVFKKNFPEVETAVTMSRQERVVGYGENLISEKRFMYADPGIFDIFSFHLLQGDPKKVIADPYNVVLTQSTAKRYFGKENPMGKSLRVGADTVFYRVSGVMEDCPSNSQIKFDFLTSFSSLGLNKELENSYWNANYTTYVLLKNAGDRASLQVKIPDFMKKEMAGQGATVNFWLEPFPGIHLHSEFEGFEPNNSISNIYILGALALLILIIACSTFINLSTAQSLERAKEVGVRKVIGAGKSQLFWQFIGESGILCLISLLCGLGLAVGLLPFFNQLSDKQFPVSSLFSWPFLCISIAIAALVSLLAGSYPAIILTRFQPVKVLKGSFKNMASGQSLRKSLIIFQFSISVFMIVSTFIIQKQLYFIQHKKLGYDRSQVLILPMGHKMYSILPLIKSEFKSDPDIMSVSGCYSTPVEMEGGYTMRSSFMPANEQIAVTASPVDEDFIKTSGMTIVTGDDLTEPDIKEASDEDQNKRTFHYILNESAARALGWTPEEAVGKKMFLGDEKPGYVKGVVKDFNFESLHHPIRPLVLFTELSYRSLMVKLSGHNLPQSISFLENKWKTLVPSRPFEYRFMDEEFNQLYSSELRLGKVMNIFSLLAIVLACFGLFGLSSYSVHQRIKEIGVRKVLGASVKNIVVLLSRDFIKLTFISLFIAFPLAWWGTTKWLDDFAFRTSMGWSIYVIAGTMVLLLALITVSFQAIRAAVANPVTSLRSE